MFVYRQPHPRLAPFVEAMWYSRTGADHVDYRDRTLPTGCMSLIFRLEGPEIRVFDDAEDAVGKAMGYSVIGGSRAKYMVRQSTRESCSIGVHFRPGVCEAIFAVPGDELAGRRTRLEDLWNSKADKVRERLSGERNPEQALLHIEQVLLRECDDKQIHPAVRMALDVYRKSPESICHRQVAGKSGYSQRRFIELFKNAVGLTPKRYERVVRFQRAIKLANQQPHQAWTDLALAAGYYDQAHLNRDFREIAGISPSEYAPEAGRPNHVPLGNPRCLGNQQH